MPTKDGRQPTKKDNHMAVLYANSNDTTSSFEITLDGHGMFEKAKAEADGGLETFYNVELIEVGEWLTSSGPAKFTTEHLEGIMASQDDPFIKPPRLILGHTPSEPEVGPAMSGKDGFFGEQPTIGKFTNLRLIEGGTKIVADLVGVPKWLGEILPTAYPSRSVEVYYNVTTTMGKYAAIMPRVAALGINLPAVASLEDLQVLYSEEGPEGVELIHVGERVAASAPPPKPPEPPAKASVDVDAVRQAYYEDFADGDRFWWWLKAMFINPSIIIAYDEDTSTMYSVPYSASKDSVEFGEPVEVFMQYVETESGKVAAQRAAREAFLLGADIVYHTAAESRPEARTHELQAKEQADARARAKALARLVRAS
jgi:hypothetical protein